MGSMAGNSSCVAWDRRESMCVVRSSARARWARVEGGCLGLWMTDFSLEEVVEDLMECGGWRGLEDCLAILKLNESLSLVGTESL